MTANFPLQPVMDLARDGVDAATARLGQAMQRLMDADRKLKLLIDYREEYQAKFRNARIGYVFQNYLLLPELTALENVAVPGAIAGEDRTEEAMKALERVGLADRAEHLPAELSGGEHQRVAIARAIVNEPKVLFADEPTGNLDSKNSAEIMKILLELATEHGVTLVVVTHDQSLAQAGDRTLIIKDGSIHAN